jgi:hypothetical protein
MGVALAQELWCSGAGALRVRPDAADAPFKATCTSPLKKALGVTEFQRSILGQDAAGRMMYCALTESTGVTE